MFMDSGVEEFLELKRMGSESVAQSDFLEFGDTEASLMEIGSGNYGYVLFSVVKFILLFGPLPFICRLIQDFSKLIFLASIRCSHYRRRCKIRAPCCNEIFDCRHCHNDAKVYMYKKL